MQLVAATAGGNSRRSIESRGFDKPCRQSFRDAKISFRNGLIADNPVTTRSMKRDSVTGR